MNTISRYWRHVSIDVKGQLRVKELNSVEIFFKEQFPDLMAALEIPDRSIQERLITLRNQSSEGVSGEVATRLLAEYCLRCYISQQIEQVCGQLETTFGNYHGFNRYDLFPFVLNDVLEESRPPLPQKLQYQSFAIEVLETFDPNRASLSTWTTRRVKHHPEINRFLLDHGVYLISDWAILNDTSSEQLNRIYTEFYSFSFAKIQQSCLVLESYHAVYRRDRLQQRRQGLAGRCLAPSGSQLQQMTQILQRQGKLKLRPEDLIVQLQDLAEHLRYYRIQIRGGGRVQPSLDDPTTQLLVERQQITAGLKGPEVEDEEKEFLTLFRQQFINSLDQALAQVTQSRLKGLKRKTGMADKFLAALQLFHCQGRSMAEIAASVGLQAQYQVSRLLKLKDFRADVRHTMLQLLRDRVLEQSKSYASPQQLQHLDQQVETALDEQVSALVQEAELEASLPRNRATDSLFARRLCRHLHFLSKQ